MTTNIDEVAREMKVARRKPLLRHLASWVQARLNCKAGGNEQWFNRHEATILEAVKNYLPFGSGFDCGTAIDLDTSTRFRLVFDTQFHHMRDGYYDGWTRHRVSVTPAFDGFDIHVSGVNRNEIKDYIAEAFHHALSEPYLTPEERVEEVLWQEACKANQGPQNGISD